MSDAFITEPEKKAIRDLRSRGFAIVVFWPEELGTLTPKQLCDSMTEHGHRLVALEGTGQEPENFRCITELTVGDEVFWTDPDAGIGSGYYTIREILTESGSISDDNDMLLISNDACSQAEVFAHELS